MTRISWLCRVAAASLAVLVSGCADRDPAGAPPVRAPEPELGPYGALRCTVQVRGGTVSCSMAKPGVAPGVRAAILGGQGLNVRLASSGTSYDAGTGILRTDVTVENLTTQMLGTEDGYLPDTAGVRVFFATGPEVTGGSGSVTVENADGTGTFTASGQRFFRYPGILAPGVTSAAKEWRFAFPPTVTTFVFTVYVAARVVREGGWITLSPLDARLAPGDTARLRAVVYDATGRVVPGAKVTWSASTPADWATVDSTGLVTAGGHNAPVGITAQSGGRTSSISLIVYDPPLGPRITHVEVSPRLVDDDGLDSVTVRFAANDPVRLTSKGVTFVSPNYKVRRPCDTLKQVSGTEANGVWDCRIAFPPGSLGGVWRVESVEAAGPNGIAVMRDYELLGAGVPASFYVRAPLQDYTPPALSSFTLSPGFVRTVFDTVTIEVAALDADTGIARVETTLTYPGSFPISCVLTQPVSGTIRNGLYRCRLRLPGAFRGTFIEVQSVRLTDRNDNVREVYVSELEARGYTARIDVQPDTVKPVITAFSFSPATVAANGVDSVTVTISATDAWSGVRQLEARFRRVGDTFERNCIAGFTAVASRTITCALRFSAIEAGTWRLLYLDAFDNAGVVQRLDAAQAQAAGYPVELTVTPP
ncbi:MAG TPA: Ig-like domain-containing protein [Longimicrobium sp.]|nr:Ig-like domain-containing protein [Longimicrobium sp.]